MNLVEKSRVYQTICHLPTGGALYGWISANEFHRQFGEPSQAVLDGETLAIGDATYRFDRIQIVRVANWHVLELTYNIAPVLEYLNLWDDKKTIAMNERGLGYENAAGQAVTASIYGVTLHDSYRVYLFRLKSERQMCVRQLAKAA